MPKCKNCKKELQLLRLVEAWGEIKYNYHLLTELTARSVRETPASMIHDIRTQLEYN